MTATTSQRTGLKIQSYFMLGFLAVQYTFGMLANLYVQFPQGDHEGQLWQYAWSQGPTSVHIIVGILLLIGAIVFAIRAAHTKERSWVVTAGVGLVAILAAAISGSLFITTQSAIFSFTMSLSFLVAFATYAVAAYKATTALALAS
jgi:hypothetical protein